MYFLKKNKSTKIYKKNSLSLFIVKLRFFFFLGFYDYLIFITQLENAEDGILWICLEICMATNTISLRIIAQIGMIYDISQSRSRTTKQTTMNFEYIYWADNIRIKIDTVIIF